MKTAISRHALAGLSSLLLSLAACGGGGDGGATATAPSAGDPAPVGRTAPLSYAHAPALAPAPAALPVVASRSVCENVALADRQVENLGVPDGATCVLDAGTVIDGNIELGTGSALFARSIRVDGNIQGQRAGSVVVERSTGVANIADTLEDQCRSLG